ncbi:hypothetical protein HK405_014001, partial [Cladochytrium tenue]
MKNAKIAASFNSSRRHLEKRTVETILAHANTLQLALELLTNLFAEPLTDADTAAKRSDPDAMDADDDEAAEDDDDDDDDAMNYDDELADQIRAEADGTSASAAAAAAAAGSLSPTDLLAARFTQLLAHGVLPQLRRLAGAALAPPLTRVPSPSPAYPCVPALWTVRLRALACLANLMAAPAAAAGWFRSAPADAVAMFDWLFDSAGIAAAAAPPPLRGADGADAGLAAAVPPPAPDDVRLDVVEAAVAAMWSLARGLDAAGLAGSKALPDSGVPVLV